MARKTNHDKPFVILAMSQDGVGKALKKLLEKKGVVVEMVETAEAALRQAEREQTAAIVIRTAINVDDDIDLLVNHGIGIYAIREGTDGKPVALIEATQSGTQERCKWTEWPAYADTWVDQIEHSGNRFAEKSPESALKALFRDSAYQVEELSRFPDSFAITKEEGDRELEQKAETRPSKADVKDSEKGGSLEGGGSDERYELEASLRLPDSTDDDSRELDGALFAGLENVDEAAELLYPSPVDSEWMPAILQESERADEYEQLLTQVDRKVQYLLHQHQQQMEGAMKRMLRTSIAVQEIKIHEIASAVAAQQAEEIYEAVAQTMRNVHASRAGSNAEAGRRRSPSTSEPVRKQDKKAGYRWRKGFSQNKVLVGGVVMVVLGILVVVANHFGVFLTTTP